VLLEGESPPDKEVAFTPYAHTLKGGAALRPTQPTKPIVTCPVLPLGRHAVRRTAPLPTGVKQTCHNRASALFPEPDYTYSENLNPCYVSTHCAACRTSSTSTGPLPRNDARPRVRNAVTLSRYSIVRMAHPPTPEQRTSYLVFITFLRDQTQVIEESREWLSFCGNQDDFAAVSLQCRKHRQQDVIQPL
jgi:hypothetical protein